MKGTARVILGIIVIGFGAAEARAQGVIVDHNWVAMFDRIPEQYLTAAANTSMMFVNLSVGGNISEGLTCLSYENDGAAPTSCKRYIHPVPEFSSPQSEVQWSRPGGYPRTNWTYYAWPGNDVPPELPCGVTTGLWQQNVECFIRYVDQHPTAYRVYGFMTSYLEVDAASDIANATTGFFARQANRYDIADYEALEARNPTRIFIHHTSSLSRATGTQVAAAFNDQLRQYARANNKYLFDIADIESHDPWGRPCYDNRDGVAYTVSNGSENYPDDGQAIPAVCQHYTRELDGGHLGNPDVGKIRLAKAFWVLMARIAGWNPGSDPTTLPPAPTNLRIIPGLW